MKASTIEVPATLEDRESGTHSSVTATLLESVGYYGAEDDENPALTLLDALRDDMRVVQLALGAEALMNVSREAVDQLVERTHIAEDAVERFMLRLTAIRALIIECSEKAPVTQ